MHHVLRNILALRANSEIERYVQQESVQTVSQLLATPRQRLYDQAIQVEDGYTVYISEADIEDYAFMTTGQYGGIGALIHKQGDYIVISEPYEGSPSMKNPFGS